MEDFKEDIIYILLVFINFLFIFNLMKFSYAVLDFDYRISFAYVAAGVLIFMLFKYGIRKTWIKLMLLFIMLLSSAFFIYKYRVLLTARLTYDFNSINSNISNNQAISFYNLFIILIIIIPLIAAALFLYNRGIYISISVLIFSFVLFLWYTGYTREIIEYLFKYTFLNVFTFAVINYIKNRKTFRKKGVKIKISVFSLLTYAVLLAVIFSSMVRVMPKEYNGKLTSDTYSYFQNKYEKKAKNPTVTEKYNISYSGYNDSSSELGGPVKLDKGKALEVFGGNFLYLRGNVKDYYTGISWLSKNNTYRNDNTSIISSSELKKSSIAEVRIKPAGLITSTVFAPPGAAEVKNDDKQVFADNFGCFLREKPYDTEYTVSYYNGYKMLDDYKNSTPKSFNPAFITGTNYLQVPDTVPQEVYDLVNDIISKNNAVSGYEKVSCLKKYLEKNYKYTLDMNELPQGADFVDNFLFKEKQGYCTYFASALTIMCRIADVPAVYVEGFKQGGSSIVTNDMAHAWVEVNLTSDSMWLIADPDTNQQSTEEPENNPSEINPNVPQKDNKTNNSTNINTEQQDTERTISLNKNIITAIIIVSSLILLIICKILFIIIRKRYLIRNSSIIPLMFHSIKRLKRLGIKKGEAEGFLEYAEKIRDSELRNNMISLSKCYCGEVFGNIKGEADKKQIYKFIENKIRTEKGFFKYYTDKILR